MCCEGRPGVYNLYIGDGPYQYAVFWFCTGVRQGDVLGPFLFGIVTLPVLEELRRRFPGTLHEEHTRFFARQDTKYFDRRYGFTTFWVLCVHWDMGEQNRCLSEPECYAHPIRTVAFRLG